jgi:hypothetical protein
MNREAAWFIEIEDTDFLRLLILKATVSIILVKEISLKKNVGGCVRFSTHPPILRHSFSCRRHLIRDALGASSSGI